MSKPLPLTSFLYHISSPDEGGRFCSQLNVIFQIKSLPDGRWSVSPAGDTGTGSPGPCIGSAAAWVGQGGTESPRMASVRCIDSVWPSACVCAHVSACLWMCLCAVEIYGGDSGCILESWSAHSSHIPTIYPTHYHSEVHMHLASWPHSRFCSHLHSLFHSWSSSTLFLHISISFLPLASFSSSSSLKKKWWQLFN